MQKSTPWSSSVSNWSFHPDSRSTLPANAINLQNSLVGLYRYFYFSFWVNDFYFAHLNFFFYEGGTIGTIVNWERSVAYIGSLGSLTRWSLIRVRHKHNRISTAKQDSSVGRMLKGDNLPLRSSEGVPLLIFAGVISAIIFTQVIFISCIGLSALDRSEEHTSELQSRN